MKRLIIYYSYTGSTAKMAEKLAEKRGCPALQVKDKQKPGRLRVFSMGVLASLRGVGWETEQLDWPAEIEHITVMSPVWAGRVTPQINTVLSALPVGKQVEIILVSGQGRKRENYSGKLDIAVRERGCTLAGIQHVRGGLAKQLEDGQKADSGDENEGAGG